MHCTMDYCRSKQYPQSEWDTQIAYEWLAWALNARCQLNIGSGRFDYGARRLIVHRALYMLYEGKLML